MDNEEVILQIGQQVDLPDLWELRVKRSKKTHLLTLKTLCLQQIVNGLHAVWVKFYQQHQKQTGQVLEWATANIVNPFEELPTSLITDLLSTLRSIGVCHPRHFRLLITGNTEELDLSGLNGGATQLMSILLKHCQHRLRVLNLEQCGCVEIPFLVTTIEKFQNLQILNLKRLGIVDSVLEVIGSVMAGLRELYLCHNNISNTGLSRLCVDDGHYGKCKELRILTLEYNEVTMDGLVLALNNLPNLRVFDNFDLSSAVLEWHKGNPGKILTLQILSVTMSELSSENIEVLLDICPAISTLIFLPTDNQLQYDLTPFLKATNLTKVMSQCSCAPTSMWFQSVGQSITHIDLLGTCNSELDLTLLDEFCPNLIHLFLHEIHLTESPSTRGARRFTKLQLASLQGITALNYQATLFSIFSAHEINYIKLILFDISDDLLCQLADIARAENQILQSLESLELWFCESVTIRGILALICVAPSLKHLGLIRCPNVTRTNFIKMKRHCMVNNVGIEMIWK